MLLYQLLLNGCAVVTIVTIVLGLVLFYLGISTMSTVADTHPLASHIIYVSTCRDE